MVTVSAADPVCAALVSAKHAVSPAPVVVCQQYGVPGLLGSAVSSEGLVTPLLPGGAGGTVGAVTAGWTGPPIPWATVPTDTFFVCSQGTRAVEVSGVGEQ